MRHPLLTTLLCLYALLGLAFAGWAVLGRGAAPGDALALPLPEWIMWLAAGVNLAIAFGGFRALPATRPLALGVHAIVTTIAFAVLGMHVLDAEHPHELGSHVEMVMKGAVHAALFCYWLRSRAVAEHLRRR